MTALVPNNSPLNQPPLTLPVQDERLNQLSLQLDQNRQEAGNKMVHLVFEVGLKMGKAIQMLQAEKLQLESANRALENEIHQLKSVHVAELNAAVDSHMAKIKMVAEAVKAIVEKFGLYKKRFKDHYFSESGMLAFSTLKKNVSEGNFEDLRQYPEYHDYRINKTRPQEQTAASPLSNALTLWKKESNLMSLIKKPMEEYEGLESKIAPLRTANLALLDKKAILIDFHEKYLAKMNQEKVEPRLKKILELVRSTYNSVQWETLAKANPGLYDLAYCEPIDAVYYTQMHQDDMNKKVKRIQETVNDVIATLEAFVNPQRIEGVT